MRSPWKPSSLYLATIFGLVPALMVVMINSLTFNNPPMAIVGIAISILPIISSSLMFKGKSLFGGLANLVYGCLLLMLSQELFRPIDPILATLEDAEKMRFYGLYSLLALFEVLSGLLGVVAWYMMIKEKRKSGGS